MSEVPDIIISDENDVNNDAVAAAVDDDDDDNDEDDVVNKAGTVHCTVGLLYFFRLELFLCLYALNYYILIYLFCLTVIHLLCYFMFMCVCHIFY